MAKIAQFLYSLFLRIFMLTSSLENSRYRKKCWELLWKCSRYIKKLRERLFQSDFWDLNSRYRKKCWERLWKRSRYTKKLRERLSWETFLWIPKRWNTPENPEKRKIQPPSPMMIGLYVTKEQSPCHVLSVIMIPSVLELGKLMEIRRGVRSHDTQHWSWRSLSH